jgi:hypothetical protein
MRQQLLNKLSEVRELLEKATCEGETISGEVEEDIYAAMFTLEETIGYYID